MASLASPQNVKFTHGASVVIRPVPTSQNFGLVSIGSKNAIISDGEYQAEVPISQILVNGKAVVTPDIFAAALSKAAKGDKIAQRDVGDDYYSGSGVKQNFGDAAKWYQKSADQGFEDAESSLGQCYENGEGVQKDATKAFQWYLRAAQQGEAWSECKVGFAYASTLGDAGTPKDDAKAVWYLQQAANQGQVNAQYLLGYSYMNAQLGLTADTTLGIQLLQTAATGGVAEAQFALGSAYSAGSGVPKSATDAVSWYKKAADQGQVQAEITLGLALGNGDGVAPDAVTAAAWFARAADSGDAEGQDRLGLCYQQGFGVKQDDALALLWFTKAAQQGNVDAELNLGDAYAGGKGVTVDPSAANGWYRKAAEAGVAAAQADLGNQYLKGIGVVKDELEGIAWIYAAAASGDQDVSSQITDLESAYTADSIVAARKRAKEIQQAVSDQSFPDQSATASNKNSPPVSTDTATTVKASGSGCFLTSDGYVLTAAHVVKGAARIIVVAADGKHPAKVVQVDENNDVALLKCDGNGYAPLPLLPSRSARLGETVFTIGFPNIDVQGVNPKMTKGEISALSGIDDDDRFWQISVPIQPGNSGGPLCDTDGNLLGFIDSTLDPLVMAKAKGELPQNVNYAVKNSCIGPMLDQIRGLPDPRKLKGSAFEDVVDSVRKSTVMILIY